MNLSTSRGLTLLELTLSIAILLMVAGAAAGLIATTLQAQTYTTSRSDLERDAYRAVEVLADEVKRSTFVPVPNLHKFKRDLLVVSAMFNDDGDFFFGDSLFPRVDEDFAWGELTMDGAAGVFGVDDDGDGLVDEGSNDDDDEDGKIDEDPIDGIDNDGDGNIDEDVYDDINNDGAPGIKGMDDDGDGQIDEGKAWDGDEDGQWSESGIVPIVYRFDSKDRVILKELPFLGKSEVFARNVVDFQAKRMSPTRILITIYFWSEDRDTLALSQNVYLRNVLQRSGKRVR